MKIMVMVDMEGISGIVSSDQVTPGGSRYDEGRQYMTWDVNACVRGCFDGGATEVHVADVHNVGRNMLWHELDPRASYSMGSRGDSRMPGVEDCDGLILLGYHAMGGTPDAVLEHTWTDEWQNFYVNGRLSGEIGIDMGHAADYGVPVIMVSGCNKACAEALSLVPNVVTAQVKESYALYGAKLLSKEKAHALIAEKAAEALKKCKQINPIQLTRPVTIRLEHAERKGQPSNRDKAYMTIIDGRTSEVTGDTFADAFYRAERS